MRMLLYLILFILVIMIIRSFIKSFKSAYEKQKSGKKGFSPRSKYENVEEAEFKEIESHKKVKKEE